MKNGTTQSLNVTVVGYGQLGVEKCIESIKYCHLLARVISSEMYVNVLLLLMANVNRFYWKHFACPLKINLAETVSLFVEQIKSWRMKLTRVETLIWATRGIIFLDIGPFPASKWNFSHGRIIERHDYMVFFWPWLENTPYYAPWVVIYERKCL